MNHILTILFLVSYFGLALISCIRQWNIVILVMIIVTAGGPIAAILYWGIYSTITELRRDK